MSSNADYGLTLQKRICDLYSISINDWAQKQFDKVYEKSFENNVDEIIDAIFKELNCKPVKLLTYSDEQTTDKAKTSPHNFLLDNGKTLSVRTTKTSDKVCPKTVGQAGFPVLNEFFSEIYGTTIETKEDIKVLITEHIDEVLPTFIDYLFQSDYTVIISKMSKDEMHIIKAEDVANYSFSKDEFAFTRGLPDWTESTTLKYHGVSIAEIQAHKKRTFKFRFKISKIPIWFKQVKINNETLGISAEAAICDCFNLEKPKSFDTRASKVLEKELFPVVKSAFNTMPKPIEHTGSTPGRRGGASKCSYDFVLEGKETLSLKTNKGNMVCPPEVGQPGSETCLLYFKDYFDPGTNVVTRENFKKMVFDHIDELMPIYFDHMFDSDWLLWIHKSKDKYLYDVIRKSDTVDFNWNKDLFSFTQNTVEDWNESNTVKYNGITIGEFQVHTNRNCFKFRFNFTNLLKLINENKG